MKRAGSKPDAVSLFYAITGLYLLALCGRGLTTLDGRTLYCFCVNVMLPLFLDAFLISFFRMTKSLIFYI